MAEPNPVCGHCAGESTTAICGGCFAIKYCSPECQQADWEWHQHLCAEFESFKTTPKVHDRPGSKSSLAIYLPAQAPKPRFIWIEVEEHGAEHPPNDPRDPILGWDQDREVPCYDPEDGSDEVDFRAAFPEGGVETPERTTLVLGKLASGERLDHSILMCHAVTSTSLPPNLCINSLIGEERGTQVKGPVILYGMTKVSESSFMVDLRLSDFTLALKGLIYHIKKSECSFPFSDLKVVQKVKGVKVTTEATGSTVPAKKYRSTFHPVDIPRMHPIFQAGKIDDFLQTSTWPLRTWMPPGSSPVQTDVESDMSRLMSTHYFHEKMFPGVPPPDSIDVLIVRKDEKDLPENGAKLVWKSFHEGIFPSLLEVGHDDPKVQALPIDKQEALEDFVVKHMKSRFRAAKN